MMMLPPRQKHYHPSDESLVIQTQFAKAMTEMAPQDGIGLALSYLLIMSLAQPEMLQKALSEPVIREGFRGVSMIETLKRVCR